MTRARHRALLALSAAVLLAAGLRLLPFRAVFPAAGPVRLVSADCDYHLLRIERVLRGEPLRVFDRDLHFPEGGVAIWPPLFDRGAALFVRVVGVVAPVEPIRLAVFWPLLLGSLFPLAVAWLSSSLLPRRWIPAAALWGAGVPAYLLWSQLGHLDQHVAEGLLAAAASALFLAGLRRPDGAGRLLRLGAASVACGALVLTWQGGIYLPALLFAAFVVARAISAGRPTPAETAAVLLPAAALVAPATALILAGEPPVPFTYVGISWFQPAFLALLAGGGALVSLRLRGTRAETAATLAGLAAGLLATALAGRHLAARLGDVAGHFLQSAPGAVLEHHGFLRYPAAWLGTIGEYRPLWPLSELLGTGRVLFTGAGLAALAVAVPLVARRLLRSALAGSPAARRREALAAFAAISLVHVLLAVLQRRYAYLAAATIAIAVPAVVRAAARLPRHRFRRSALGVAPAVAAALLLLAFPFWKSLPGTVQGPGGDSAAFLDAAARLGPPPRGADGRAEWGALVPWALGHTFRRATGIPVVADNFGYGFEEQADVYLAPSDAHAFGLLTARRVRYVLAAPLEPLLPRWAALLGRRAPGEDVFALRLRRGEADPRLFRPVLSSRSGDRLPDGRIVPRWRLYETTGYR